MSEDPVGAFQRLTAALTRLEQAAAQEPARSGELAANLARGYAEGNQTHQALLERMQDLGAQWEKGSQELAKAGRRTGDSLAQYRQKLEQSALETANELEGPQNEADALGEILYLGLYELRQRLIEWDGTEAGADRSRYDVLLSRQQRLARGQELLAGIVERLSGAGASSHATLEGAGREAAAEAWQQAAALNRQAIRTYQAGRIRTALALLAEAVRLAPADAAIQLNLARLCAEQGETARAEELCRRAEALLPEGSTALAYTQGLLALRRSDYVRAMGLLTRATEAAAGLGEEVSCRLSLAEACYRAGHPQLALAQWRQVLALDPGQPVAQAALGMLE